MKLYEHPEYKELSKLWIQYKILYDGVGVNEAFLIPHEFERGDDKVSMLYKQTRWARTEYTNLCEPFINRFTSMMFSGHNDYSIIRETLGDDVFQDVDGNGNSFEDFIRREICRDYLLYGKVTVYVDAPEGAYVRPYLKTISPLDIKNWKRDFTGLKALRYEHEEYEIDDTLTSEPASAKMSTIAYLEGDKLILKFYKKSQEWESAGEQVISIDELPFLQIEAETRMERALPILRAKHNLESSHDNQLLFQSMQRIVILAKDISTDAPVVLNEAGVAVIDGEGSIQVIDPSEPLALERRIEARLNDFFKVAFNQTRHIPADSRGVQGADTIRATNEEFTKQVENAAKDIEQLCNNIFRVMCKRQGVKYPEDKRITIGDELDVDDLQAQVQNAMAFYDEMKKYPTWRKEFLQKLAKSQNLTNQEDVLKEIKEKEITQDNTFAGLLSGRNNQATETAR